MGRWQPAGLTEGFFLPPKQQYVTPQQRTPATLLLSAAQSQPRSARRNRQDPAP